VSGAVTAAFVVFAKAPYPGAVKTRMTPGLRPEAAADLYRCMLEDVLEATADAARVLGAEPVLAVHPPGAVRELAGLAPAAFRIVAQRGPDLGRRMEWAVAEAAAAGARAVVLRGSDSPAVGASAFHEALAALDEADLALSPDPDGGYNLAALRRPVPGLFDHPMSTASVLEDTRLRARALGLRVRTLAPGFDLDTLADLALLAEARRADPGLACARTLAWLDRHEVWKLAPD
jgi:rSAM/selenodomain-associated transferase 1